MIHCFGRGAIKLAGNANLRALSNFLPSLVFANDVILQDHTEAMYVLALY